MVLLYNEKTKTIRLSDLITGDTNSIRYNFNHKKDEVPLGYIHNHPSGESASINDLWALIRKCYATKGKFQHLIVAPRENSTVLDLQVVDTTKAYIFMRKISSKKDTIGMDATEYNKLKKALGSYREEIEKTSDTSSEDESIEKRLNNELTFYAFAHLLEREKAGVVLLQLIDGEFKMLGAEEERVIVNQDTTTYLYRERCK